MPPGLVVFDLDGTLVDGYAGITDALGYAMRGMGLVPATEAEVRRMVGEGLERLLEKAVGADRSREGLALFRERYGDVAVPLSRLMPGARETLEALERSGWRMAVASNKPAGYSRMILEALSVARFFLEVSGPDGETPAKPDPAMLLGILVRAGFSAAETVVVGDMEIDARFGRAAGCRVVLVPGGSRTKEELEMAAPDALLGELSELPAWLESPP
jgi:phosphoglycolate phosphatase